MRPTRTLSEANSRDAARKLSASVFARHPSDIDLPTLCWLVGRLRIEEGELNTADGRLVASKSDGGYIRYRSGLSSEGRKRFIVAHELGHFCLHKMTGEIDTAKDFMTYKKGNVESEANLFAAELLMPKDLVVPHFKGILPTLACLRGLSEEFTTSHIATIVQFIKYTYEPCAFVFSKEGEIQWFKMSGNFGHYLEAGAIRPFSAASDIFRGKAGDTNGFVDVSAGSWLRGYDLKGSESIKEDSYSWRSWDCVLTMLWIEDEI